MLRSYAAKMDKEAKLVGNGSDATILKTQNVDSKNGASSESQNRNVSSVNDENKVALIAAAQRYPDRLSVQNIDTSSEAATLDSSKTNRRQGTKSSEVQPKKAAQVRGDEESANPKKARQRLRKGKWTIEEEEYTSRIIQYFSTGLLTLPDGATLRSYLAEKLNCDPMRITKKFTGACCLGRRAYHLRDRPRASPAEIEMASFELLHLEQRFRLRVEHEQTGLPLPPRHELLASQPPSTATVVPSLFTLQQGASSIQAQNHWIQNPVLAPIPAQSSLLPGLAGIIPGGAVPNANANLNLQNSSSLLLAAGQFLLQNPSERTQASNSSSVAAAAAPLQMLNNLVASYALSRAITQQQAGMSVLQTSGPTLSPIISPSATKSKDPNPAPPTRTINFNAHNVKTNVSRNSPPIPVVGSQDAFSKNVQPYRHQQHEEKNLSSSTPRVSRKEEHTKKLKAAFEEQQRALRMAYEKSLKDAQEREEQYFSSDIPDASSNSKGGNQTINGNSTSGSSKASLDTVSPAEQLQRSYEAHLASLQRAEQQASLQKSSKSPFSSSPLEPASGTFARNETQSAKKEEENTSPKKTQDEEAGVILLGFLNSLRESFEDAVEAKKGNKTKERPNKNSKNKRVNIQSIRTVEPESPTGTTESNSDSSAHIVKRYNGNDHAHPHVSINTGRQTSDTITSLSHFQSSKRKVKPASVTETSSSTSSQPTIEQPSSSQEDSKSDKMSHSSSEESEKEIAASRRTSKGPPRKRLKDFHEPSEFTRENLMAHSKRMDMECGQSGNASSSDE